MIYEGLWVPIQLGFGYIIDYINYIIDCFILNLGFQISSLVLFDSWISRVMVSVFKL